MTVYLLAIGLISILGQVVLLRELNVAFYGIELIYLLALGIWLLWTAAGTVIGRRFNSPSLQRIAALFIIFGMVLPLDIVFIRASRLLFGGIPGAYLTFLQQLMIAALAVLPAGLLSGLLFQWTATSYVANGKTLAAAYALESAGGLIGGLFSTLFIIWGLQNWSIGLVCALCSVLTPLIFLKGGAKSYLRRAAIILACIFLIFLGKTSYLDQRMTMWNYSHLLESSDSPYGRITLTKLYNQISVFENDALSFETEGIDAEYFCHLAALQHPNPQRVLILGGGIEGLVRETAKYNPTQIDYVELNPVMLNLAMKYLPDDIRRSLKEPNVRIIFADPRQYLKNCGKYDLILVGMPQPSSGQTNRFYTREFFRQCSLKLKPGGILGFRLHTAENLWTVSLTQLNKSIYSALQSVFPETLFLPGTTSVITASHALLPQNPEVMSRRLQDMKITTRFISPLYINYLFTNDRFFTIKNLFNKEKAPPNTDIRPVCYQQAFIIWLSKFFPRVALVDLSSMMSNIFSKPVFLLLSVCLSILFLLSRFRPALRRALLVAAAGFTGMVLETVLILYYQVKYGVLYQDIGLLLMSFMAGLALGAITINKAMTRMSGHQKHLRRYGIGLIAGSCVFYAFTGMMITMNISAGLLQISFLLAATGFLVAGIFAYASLHEIEDQKKIISPLYAADLIGGCLGSLTGSLILIPLAGMDITCWGMLLLAFLSLLLV